MTETTQQTIARLEAILPTLERIAASLPIPFFVDAAADVRKQLAAAYATVKSEKRVA